MRSVKAILAGSLFIIVVMFFIQLAIIFLTVGYNSLAKSLPILHEISIYFRYLLAYPIFLGVLFAGGYITAAIVKEKVLQHCFVVACITIGISTASALDYMVLTLTGILIVIVALLAVMTGGMLWQRRHRPAG